MGRTNKNSEPSGRSAVACSECGIPGGKYHKSPAFWKQCDLKDKQRHPITYDIGHIIAPILVDRSYLCGTLLSASGPYAYVMEESDGPYLDDIGPLE